MNKSSARISTSSFCTKTSPPVAKLGSRIVGKRRHRRDTGERGGEQSGLEHGAILDQRLSRLETCLTGVRAAGGVATAAEASRRLRETWPAAGPAASRHEPAGARRFDHCGECRIGAGGDQLVVMGVNVVAELHDAAARHPAGEIDPGDRDFLRQPDFLLLTRGDTVIDCGGRPFWQVLEHPGGEIAHIVDARAAVESKR